MKKSKPLLEEAAELSSYHFNPDRIDYRFDTVKGIGQFEGDWSKDLADAIAKSKPVSMATRSRYTDGDGGIKTVFRPFMDNGPGFKEPHYSQEKDFFDTTDISYEEYEIVNKTGDLGPTLMKMVNAFKLEEPFSYTFHCQTTGQVFPYHIDFFHRREVFRNEPQEKIIRIMVMLTDWEPGHLFGFGNHTYTNWKAGDISTFSHANVPHYTANAAYNPRCILLITGMKSPETEKFFWQAENSKTIKVDDLE